MENQKLWAKDVFQYMISFAFNICRELELEMGLTKIRDIHVILSGVFLELIYVSLNIIAA